MALPDTQITNWAPDYVQAGGADTNSPKGTDSMAGTLDQQLRELKSVSRQESVNKQWERWLGIPNPGSPSSAAPVYVSATQFTLTGDWTTAGTYYPAIALVNRRVKALVSAGTIYGSITATSVAGGITTVTVAWDSGALDSGLTEVQFGAITPTNGALPANVETQSTTPLFASVTNGGSGNAYTGSLSPAITGYVTGQLYRLFFQQANSGAVTVALNGLAAVAVVRDGVGGSNLPLTTGDILNNQNVDVVYNGTRFKMVSPSAQLATSGDIGIPDGARNLTGSCGNGATTFAVTADRVILRNPTNNAGTVVSSFSATVNLATAGPALNGRDQAGAFAAGNTVHLYAIGGGGQTAGLIASLAAPSSGPTLPANYTSWTYLASFVLVTARSVSDGVTNGTTTVTSATANFTAGDIGTLIADSSGDIPAGAYIAAVASSTQITLSTAATGSHSGDTLTIGSGVQFRPCYLRGKRVFYAAQQNALNLGTATSESAISVSALIPGVALAWQGQAEALASDSAAFFTHTVNLRVLSGSDLIVWSMRSNSSLNLIYNDLAFELPQVSQRFYYFWSSSDPTNQLSVWVLGYEVPNGA